MEPVSREELSSRLLKTDEEYQRLARQHSEYDRRLEELSRQQFPSQEEQVEEARLKKLKLSLKDRMYEILRRHQQQAS